ncbi:MAG: RNA 2',3'-cyclic phosphodiesterase [Halobacteriota archaeon]
MRLFVSVDLPEALSDSIAAIQEELARASGIRPTDPTQTHVTLKFLGEVAASRVDTVVEGLTSAVDRAEVAPFEAEVTGLGVFPDLEYITVVWLGFTDGAAELTALADAVETELTARGFDERDHAFTPHATIARMDHAGGKAHVQRVVEEHSPELGRVRVDAIALTESELTPDGPRYTTIERIPLADDGVAG